MIFVSTPYTFISPKSKSNIYIPTWKNVIINHIQLCVAYLYTYMKRCDHKSHSTVCMTYLVQLPKEGLYVYITIAVAYGYLEPR